MTWNMPAAGTGGDTTTAGNKHGSRAPTRTRNEAASNTRKCVLFTLATNTPSGDRLHMPRVTPLPSPSTDANSNATLLTAPHVRAKRNHGPQHPSNASNIKMQYRWQPQHHARWRRKRPTKTPTTFRPVIVGPIERTASTLPVIRISLCLPRQCCFAAVFWRFLVLSLMIFVTHSVHLVSQARAQRSPRSQFLPSPPHNFQWGMLAHAAAPHKRIVFVRHAQAQHNYLLSKGRREEVCVPVNSRQLRVVSQTMWPF